MSTHFPLPKAVIFDLNGTIITTGDYEQIVKSLIAAHYYAPLTTEQENIIRSIAGLIKKNVAPIIIRHFDVKMSTEELEEYLWDQICSKLTFTPGFPAFLDFLKKHSIEVAIATNLNKETLANYTHRLGLDQMFGNHIYSFEDVASRVKPDPAVFLYAADMLGMLPSECIVFEDSERGFMAAQAAGMTCIAIKRSYNHSLLDYVEAAVDDFNHALALFE